LVPIATDELEEFDPVVENDVKDYTDEFKEFADYFREMEGIEIPETPEEAVNLYVFLIEKIVEHS